MLSALSSVHTPDLATLVAGGEPHAEPLQVDDVVTGLPRLVEIVDCFPSRSRAFLLQTLQPQAARLAEPRHLPYYLRAEHAREAETIFIVRRRFVWERASAVGCGAAAVGVYGHCGLDPRVPHLLRDMGIGSIVGCVGDEEPAVVEAFLSGEVVGMLLEVLPVADVRARDADEHRTREADAAYLVEQGRQTLVDVDGEVGMLRSLRAAAEEQQERAFGVVFAEIDLVRGGKRTESIERKGRRC